MLVKLNGKNKYRNKKVVIDNITFDSTKEGKAYLILKDMQERGCISDLQLHPQWELQPKLTESYVKHLKTKDKICERTVLQPIKYTADFSFVHKGKLIVVDIKGSKFTISKDFDLRKKMFRYKYGLDIHVVFNLNELNIYKGDNDIQ